MKHVPGVSPDRQRQPCTPVSKPHHGSMPKHNRTQPTRVDSLVMRRSLVASRRHGIERQGSTPTQRSQMPPHTRPTTEDRAGGRCGPDFGAGWLVSWTCCCVVYTETRRSPYSGDRSRQIDRIPAEGRAAA